MSAFNKVVSTIKEHPLIVAGGVGAVVLIVMLRGSGSKSQASPGIVALTVDPNVVAANAQMQMSHDALSAHGVEVAAQVAMNSANNATAVSLANLQGQTASLYLDMQRALGLSSISAAEKVESERTAAALAAVTNTNASDVQRTSIAADAQKFGDATTAGMFGIAANTELVKANQNYELGKLKLTLEHDLSTIGLTGHGPNPGVINVNGQTLWYNDLLSGTKTLPN